MKYILFFIICLFSAISCTNELSLDLEQQIDQRNFSGAFGFDDPHLAIEQLGNYMLFGYYTDFVARLDMTRISSGATSGFILLNYTPSPGQPSADAGTVTINGIESAWNDELSRYTQSTSDAQSLTLALKNECFGNRVNFSIERPGFRYSHDMYIPRDINLESISDEGIVEGSYTHRINRNNTAISWNSDENNENGVLVFVRWDGTTSSSVLGALHNEVLVERAVVLPDNGSATLPTDLFDNIPADARVSFNLVRGNFAIVDGQDGRTYKNYGISFDKRKFLMIN